MRRFSSLLILAFLCIQASSQENNPYDPLPCLGLSPEDAYRKMGPPMEIYPVKVSENACHVVHYYASQQYLFWFSNRIWQVRLDKRFKGTFGNGLKMGMSWHDCQSQLGASLGKGDNWEIWTISYKGFPRRLRLVFENNSLTDAYYYRSDL